MVWEIFSSVMFIGIGSIIILVGIIGGIKMLREFFSERKVSEVKEK